MKINIYTKILAGILIAIVLLVGVGIVMAHGNFNETEQLVDSGISCEELSEEQFEEIGDYYMEQMHPGEAHELMHNMMGGEDSETTKLMHTNMAKSIYCGEQNSGMMGMMNMMMGGKGMMDGRGMMDNMMPGMMGNYYGWNIYNVLYLILLVGLIILVVLVIIRLIKGLEKKR